MHYQDEWLIIIRSNKYILYVIQKSTFTTVKEQKENNK